MANKIFQFTVVLFIYFCNQFVTPCKNSSHTDVTAVSLNNQHGMKRREQDFDKTFIWNQYEEIRLAILNTEISKFAGEQQS